MVVHLLAALAELPRPVYTGILFHAISARFHLAALALLEMSCLQPLAVLLNPLVGFLSHKLNVALIVEPIGCGTNFFLPDYVRHVGPFLDGEHVTTRLLVWEELRKQNVSCPHICPKVMPRSDR